MPTRFGKYILLHQLAVGGMAEIYLAKQTGLEGFEKLVVLKKILPTMTEQREFVEMFVNEARIAARLNHPQIVQIYDLGRVKNSYFIAMEYVHGEDLRAISKVCGKRGSPLPFWHVARIVAELLQGLHFAHTRTDGRGAPMCIVHRDVSPQNILVSYEGTVKIVDFGIAKATLTPLTMAGVIKGKYAYMSPEQCRGEPLDGRADLFSAGIILYELCTGQRLFKRPTDFTTLMAVKEAAVVPPRTIRPELPQELERIIMRSLERDLTRRYATAQEMQLDLEEFVRKGQYQTGNVALSGLMRELFTDKLAAQAEAVKHSQVDSFEALLLEDNDLEPSIITGVGADDPDDEPSPGLVPHATGSVATAAAVPSQRARAMSLPEGPGLLDGALPLTSDAIDGAEGAPTAAATSPLDLSDGTGTGIGITGTGIGTTGTGTTTPGLSDGQGPSFLGPPTAPRLRAGLGGDGDLPATRELAAMSDAPMEDQETLQLDPSRLALSGRMNALLNQTPPPGPSLPPSGQITTPVQVSPDALGPKTVTHLAHTPTASGVPRGGLSPRTAVLAGGALILLAALGALLGRMLFGREQLSSFVVKSTPAGAVIELDGLLMQARTPAQLSSVAAGRDHTLRLALPGFDRFETRVKVPLPEPGTQPVSVTAMLIPTQSAVMLSSSPPGASVELDGQARPGTTPMLLVDLAPGPHQLVLRKDDLGGRVERLVLAPKELRTLDVALAREGAAGAKGTLTLRTSVPAAVSLADGKPLGTTPLEAVAVPAGELNVVLRWKNRRRQAREKRLVIGVTAGQLTEQKVDLARD